MFLKKSIDLIEGFSDWFLQLKFFITFKFLSKIKIYPSFVPTAINSFWILIDYITEIGIGYCDFAYFAEISSFIYLD